VTGAGESLAARAEALPPGSTRRRVIEGARRFKAAWVEFARLLSEVRRGELWREWGYPSFDRYCAAELEGSLTRRSGDKFNVVQHDALREALQTKGLAVKDLHTNAVRDLSVREEKLPVLAGCLPCVHRPPQWAKRTFSFLAATASMCGSK